MRYFLFGFCSNAVHKKRLWGSGSFSSANFQIKKLVKTATHPTTTALHDATKPSVLLFSADSLDMHRYDIDMRAYIHEANRRPRQQAHGWKWPDDIVRPLPINARRYPVIYSTVSSMKSAERSRKSVQFIVGSIIVNAALPLSQNIIRVRFWSREFFFAQGLSQGSRWSATSRT